LRKGLQQLGWTVGQNIRIDYRWGDGKSDNMRKFADELVSLAPDCPPGQFQRGPIATATGDSHHTDRLRGCC
jgi:hypothetical protein